MSDGTLNFDTKIDNSGAKTGIASLKGIITAGIAFAIGKQAVGIAKMGIDYNAQMEQYHASFKTMLGSADKATAHINDLKKMAAATPFEMSDLAEGSKTLMSFGDDTKQIMPHLRMLGDISQGNKEKFNALSLVFGQVKSQGKLMGQDLLQMINAGFNPLKVISDKTGESMSSLKNRMSKGQISFEEVADAMETATSKGGKFYHAMKNQSKTLNGRLSTLRDNVKELIGTLTKPIFNAIKDNILPAALSAVSWMSHHLPVVKSVIAAIGTALTVYFALSKFNAIKTAVLGIGKAISLAFATNPIFLAVAAIAALTAGLIVFFKSGGKLSDIGKIFTALANKIKAALPGILTAISGFLAKLGPWLEQKISNLGTFITKAIPKVFQFIASSIPKMIGGLTQLFAGHGEKAASSGINGTLVGILKGLAKIGIVLLTATPRVFLSIVVGMLKALPHIVVGVVKITIAIVKALVKGLGKLTSIGGRWILSLGKGFASRIGAVANTVLSGARRLPRSIVSGIGSLVRIARSWLNGLISGIRTGLGKAAGVALSGARAIPRRIKSGIGSLVGIGRNIMQGLVNGIKQGFRNVFGVISSLGKKCKDKLKSVFDVHSPSRFTFWIGEMLIKGLDKGISINTKGLVNSVGTQMAEVRNAFRNKPLEINPLAAKFASLKNSTLQDGAVATVNEVNQVINIHQPVSSPLDTARAIKNQAIKLGLAGV